MASDGVWEFLDSNKIMSMVNGYFLKNDPEGAVNYIVNESTMWWEKVINNFNIYFRKILLLMI